MRRLPIISLFSKTTISNCPPQTPRLPIFAIRFLFIIFSLIGALQVQAITYPVDITITFPNGQPDSGVNFVIISRDYNANTTETRWDVTNGDEIYSTTVSYTCINNLVSFAFYVQYLNGYGNLVGGYSGGGGMSCDLQTFFFHGPLTIESGTQCAPVEQSI